jgi:hypothetical protein
MTNRLIKHGKFAEASLDPVIVAIFFASGFAALIYQIIWQRALFTTFGINVEAVTVVVTGFPVRRLALPKKEHSTPCPFWSHRTTDRRIWLSFASCL